MDRSVVLAAPTKMIIPVIKVVGMSCNLRCTYCFYHARDQLVGNVMSLSLVEKFIREYLELFSGEICLNWHGGEPLLAGVEFFEKVVEYESQYAGPQHKIQNTIQTNGILINDNWAKFFKRNDFGVGVSIDGDQQSHDRFRKTKNNRGSFRRVLKGIETLRRHDIDPGIIQTVVSQNSAETTRNFHFLVKELKCAHLGVNFFVDQDGVNAEMIGCSVTNKDMEKIMRDYFELWLQCDDPQLRIREIDNIICGVTGKRATTCIWNGSCANFICLNFNGNVYPFCDRMSNRDDLIIGNLGKSSLREILNSRGRIKHIEAVNELPEDCLNCKWLNACRNGCPSQRTEGLAGRYIFCDARKALFEYVEKRVAELTPETNGNEKEEKSS